MTPEMKVSLGSMFVSFCAMLTTVGQFYIQRKHNKLMVRPLLDFTVHTIDHTPYSWTVTNCGMGPAIITDFTLSIGAKTLTFPELNQIDAALNQIGITIPAKPGNFTKKSYLHAGESIKMLEFESKDVKKISALFDHIKWDIGYTCAYGQEFTLSLRGMSKA